MGRHRVFAETKTIAQNHRSKTIAQNHRSKTIAQFQKPSLKPSLFVFKNHRF
jgi:hypothetical protein